jgi:hypothetical protein
MTRKVALDLVYVAAYHDDKARMTRLLIENKISRAAFNEAVANGRKAKASGMRCNCTDCASI